MKCSIENLPPEIIFTIGLYLESRTDIKNLIKCKGRVFLCLYDLWFTFNWYKRHNIAVQLEKGFLRYNDMNLRLMEMLLEYIMSNMPFFVHFNFNESKRLKKNTAVENFLEFCIRKKFNSVVMDYLDNAEENFNRNDYRDVMIYVVSTAERCANVPLLKQLHKEKIFGVEIFSAIHLRHKLYRHCTDIRMKEMAETLSEQIMLEIFVCNDLDFAYDLLCNVIDTGFNCAFAFFKFYMLASLNKILYEKFSKVLLKGLKKMGISLSPEAEIKFQDLIVKAQSLEFPMSELYVYCLEIVIRFRDKVEDLNFVLAKITYIDFSLACRCLKIMCQLTENSAMVIVFVNQIITFKELRSNISLINSLYFHTFLRGAPFEQVEFVINVGKMYDAWKTPSIQQSLSSNLQSIEDNFMAKITSYASKSFSNDIEAHLPDNCLCDQVLKVYDMQTITRYVLEAVARVESSEIRNIVANKIFAKLLNSLLTENSSNYHIDQCYETLNELSIFCKRRFISLQNGFDQVSLYKITDIYLIKQVLRIIKEHKLSFKEKILMSFNSCENQELKEILGKFIKDNKL